MLTRHMDAHFAHPQANRRHRLPVGWIHAPLQGIQLETNRPPNYRRQPTDILQRGADPTESPAGVV